MATFFLDYEGGSDAADGLSFANRWKTINNGATAARIAPGDTIRVMASPDPTSLGINATWTNLSPTVTLASALNVLVDNCDTAWTASPNVTCTANTSTYRTATGSASTAFAGAFTTGLASFRALGSAQNYSAYQGLTFWIQTNIAIAASTLSLRLCSDVAGVTTVNTIVIPALPVANVWVPVYVDTAGALGASIQSIALYADSDPGTPTVLLDNISVVKAAGADNLNLTSLISKNTAGEFWWAIRSINGTAVVLDNAPGSGSASTPKGYVGTTEAVTTHKRETIKVVMSGSAAQPVQDSGTAGNLITFSCGWNRTDMSTQTGYTYMDGQGGVGIGWEFSVHSFVHVDRWFSVRYGTGLVCTTPDNSYGEVGSIACSSIGISVGTAGTRLNTNLISVIQGTAVGLALAGAAFTCNEAYVYGFGETSSTGANVSGRAIRINILKIKNIGGSCLGVAVNPTNNLTINELDCSNGVNGITQSTAMSDVLIKTLTLTSLTGNAFSCAGGIDFRIGALTITNCGVGFWMSPLFTNTSVVIGSLTTSGNTSALLATPFTGEVRIAASSFAEATPLAFTGSDYTSGRFVFQHYNGTPNDHRTYYGSLANGATVFADSTTRHVENGLSWKFTVNNATFVNVDFPVPFPVARIAVKAATTYMAAIWTQRTHTGAVGTFRCRGGQLAGIPNDVTASSGAAIDTWEQLVITFTPSIDGVLDLDFSMYGPASEDVYIHDFTVST